MKNNSNIYDIDGELIRKYDDDHKWTIDEAKEKIQYYQAKIKEIAEKEEQTKEDKFKLAVYETYCKNLMNYEWSKLLQMNKDEFTAYMTANMPQGAPTATEEEVKNALNELKNDIETGENTENEVSGSATTDNANTTNEELGNDEAVERKLSDVQEGRSVSQSDLLVERDDVTTNMDEYVDFEEVG